MLETKWPEPGMRTTMGHLSFASLTSWLGEESEPLHTLELAALLSILRPVI